MRATANNTPAPAASGLTMREVVAPGNVRAAWDRVRSNDGAPGIDRVSIDHLTPRFEEEWARVSSALLAGTYQPNPVRCVDIPKPGGGTRTLGIPTVMDRVIQQATAQVLAPLWEPGFSDHCFGYRPGRGARDAVLAAERLLESGFHWVVDLDIEKFFDRIDHTLLCQRLALRNPDREILELIHRFLGAGAVKGGFRVPTPEGTPQGSPLSPLLANIVLDEFDKELERAGHPFVRYADDALLFAPSRIEAVGALKCAEAVLSSRLHLVLNGEKTRVVEPHEASFLGFTFQRNADGTIRREISPEVIEGFKSRVAEITAWKPGKSADAVLLELGDYVRGWNIYFRLCETPAVLPRLRARARVAARRYLWCEWATVERRERELVRRGISPANARALAFESPDADSAAAGPVMGQAFPNTFFDRFGLGESRPGSSEPYLPRSCKIPWASPKPTRPSTPAGQVASTSTEGVRETPVPSGGTEASGAGGVRCGIALRLGRFLSLTFDLHCGNPRRTAPP